MSSNTSSTSPVTTNVDGLLRLESNLPKFSVADIKKYYRNSIFLKSSVSAKAEEETPYLVAGQSLIWTFTLCKYW